MRYCRWYFRWLPVSGSGILALAAARAGAPEVIAVDINPNAALAAAEKLATDIVAYDVSDQLAITDAFLLCTGANDRQVRSIIDEVELRLKQAGATLVRREGENEGRWVLLDYNDIVVHVQNKEERVFYALERIWKDCPVIALPEAALAANGTQS